MSRATSAASDGSHEADDAVHAMDDPGMNDDSFGFAPPPFDADAALQRLRRDLRELGLTEREGAFERAGLQIARISRGDGPAIEASIARQPARAPEWQSRKVRDSAGARAYVADLKKRLAAWSDRDE